MFTGIVEHLGSVLSVTEEGDGRSFVIDSGPVSKGIELGQSVAVNGACLTVVGIDERHLMFQAVGETVDRTNLGGIRTGDSVNLERPMPASGRFDGHIVQGHVDGIAAVSDVQPSGDGVLMRFETPPALSRYIVEKGSITVDGVSLTVTTVEGDTVGAALIPHTLKGTTLGSRRVGDVVNLEVDVIAKYVEKLTGAHT